MTRKKIFIYFLFAGCWLLGVPIVDGSGCFSYAEEVTILYTGETHAMLYPCSCPKESDGGIARRATLINQLREKDPYALLLDSGGFFAGGLMDEYTQNTQLDMERSRINLKAMGLMQYDAVAIGDDEFNFGRQFLEGEIVETKIPFLSCNIEPDPTKSYIFFPYIIKEVSGIKIGIIGATALSARQKAGGLEFIEPKIAVSQAIEELKKKGVAIIILLSHLGENDDLRLINDVRGIDVLITGHMAAGERPSNDKIGSTLFLRPTWQGRHIGKAVLTIKDDKIINYKVEELRLSDEIADDPVVLSILPRCFSDSDCKKEGLIGTCQNAGTLKSQCLFTKAAKISLLIITPKFCKVCNTERVIEYLKTQFPGLVVSYLYYPNAKANRLVKDFAIQGLPAYLLGKETEKEKNFNILKGSMDLKGDFYMLKPQFSGLAYFINREKIKGRLDLFISLYDKDISGLLDALKEFNPRIHFLAIEQQDKFNARGGNPEVQEYLRSVCVQKYYPQNFWDYISCRSKNKDNSWWEDCLGNLETGKIITCAKGNEGSVLLKENISLNKELQIMFGPTYLLDNCEIFATQGIPTKEELEEIIKR